MDLIIILERLSVTPGTVRYVLRATVPVDRQPFYADPTKTSAYADCSEADLAALRAGQIVEHVDVLTISGDTPAVLKTRLIGHQADFQASVNADGVYNPWKYYGTRWDGTTWTNAGVN